MGKRYQKPEIKKVQSSEYPALNTLLENLKIYKANRDFDCAFDVICEIKYRLESKPHPITLKSIRTYLNSSEVKVHEMTAEQLERDRRKGVDKILEKRIDI